MDGTTSSLSDASSGGPYGRRWTIATALFAAGTLGATVLLGRRLTHTSWPLERAHMGLVGGRRRPVLPSYVLRALGWQKLFPPAARPGRSRCLTACGAAAASGVILPFRLDYVVKIATLRRMPGVKLGLEAIALLDHLARPRRRRRVPAALDLGDGDELLDLPAGR